MRSLLRTLYPAALAFGFILSPESLTKLGNGMGQGGIPFLACLALAALLHAAHAWSCDRPGQFLPGPKGESGIFESFMGARFAFLLPLVVRAPAFVCLGTAVLATAGFVFNEVFVYWFPNFALAFLLLGALFLINLLSPRFALMVQALCAATGIIGLLGLCLAALVAWDSAPVLEGRITGGPGMPSAGLALTVFVGYELALCAPSTGSEHSGSRPVSRFVVAFAACLFLLWTVVSFHFVPLDKLAESSVPHMLTARLILGGPGRIVMGMVVLAGCCGVVNGSFLALSGLVSEGYGAARSGGAEPKVRFGGRAGAFLLAVAIAAALGMGVAGASELNVWLRGSMLLWLLGYAIFHLAFCAVMLRRHCDERARAGPDGRFWFHAVLLVLLLGAVATSVWMDPERNSLAAFMLLAPPILCIILVPWYYRLAAGRDHGL